MTVHCVTMKANATRVTTASLRELTSAYVSTIVVTIYHKTNVMHISYLEDILISRWSFQGVNLWVYHNNNEFWAEQIQIMLLSIALRIDYCDWRPIL